MSGEAEQPEVGTAAPEVGSIWAFQLRQGAFVDGDPRQHLEGMALEGEVLPCLHEGHVRVRMTTESPEVDGPVDVLVKFPLSAVS